MLGKRTSAAAVIGLALATACPQAASARPRRAPSTRSPDEPTARGVSIELMPAATVCLPTLVVDCKNDNGRTGPMFGGGFNLGYRPVHHVTVGVAYNGGGLTPRYDAPSRDYEAFGHAHTVMAFLRPVYAYRRLDVGLEAGAGWGIITFPTPSGKINSNGFSAKLAPTIDVWLTGTFFLGVRVDFLLNLHTRFCVHDDSGKSCQRRDEAEQLPIHLVQPGIHLGFVL